MGQYYMIVNLDKEEYIHPHNIGCGLKMGEIAANNAGRLLTYLLGTSTGAGGGDPRGDPETQWGRWAGDRIIITGDYDEETKDESGRNLYDRAKQDFDEISDIVAEPFNEFIEIEEHQVGR